MAGTAVGIGCESQWMVTKKYKKMKKTVDILESVLYNSYDAVENQRILFL